MIKWLGKVLCKLGYHEYQVRYLSGICGHKCYRCGYDPLTKEK